MTLEDVSNDCSVIGQYLTSVGYRATAMSAIHGCGFLSTFLQKEMLIAVRG